VSAFEDRPDRHQRERITPIRAGGGPAADGAPIAELLRLAEGACSPRENERRYLAVPLPARPGDSCGTYARAGRGRACPSGGERR